MPAGLLIVVGVLILGMTTLAERIFSWSPRRFRWRQDGGARTFLLAQLFLGALTLVGLAFVIMGLSNM